MVLDIIDSLEVSATSASRGVRRQRAGIGWRVSILLAFAIPLIRGDLSAQAPSSPARDPVESRSGPSVSPPASEDGMLSFRSPSSWAFHETPVGAFIDPLVTEHAFVDRKVRSDFRALFPRDSGAGNGYVNIFVFEYAFTNWFALEFAQPLIFLNPDNAPSENGLGDLGWGAKFEILHGPESGNVIFSLGLEGSLPSGAEEVGAGEEWEIAPFLALDYAFGDGTIKVQSNAEAEYAIPRDPDEESQWEAIVWNTAFSFYPSEKIVPLLEFNSSWEGISDDTRFIFAITPGVVVSLSDIAGTRWDIAGGAQVFVGDDREEDVTLIISLRYHWPFGRWTQGRPEGL
jgi:hypothetical protein